MALKVIVFDFDGTLVESNRLKFDAFFELFPSDKFHNWIIKETLNNFLEESRYIILREIIKRVNSEVINEDELDNRIQLLADKYNAIVVDGAKHCNEKSGASEVLEILSKRYKLYLSSTTPETSLKEIVKYRKWEGFFHGIFGYPNDKVSVLLEIIRKETIDPEELLVVGDGKSDRDSAHETGCRFFYIHKDMTLIEMLKKSGI
jgi:phosphoglycolate phosphatase-like HAD superfamily hydrolase